MHRFWPAALLLQSVLLYSIPSICALQAQSPLLTDRSEAACQPAYAAGHYREAADCFAKAVEAQGGPTHASSSSALLMQARSLLALQQPGQAEQAVRASLQAAPNAPDALYLLGALLQQRNAARESLETYTRAAAVQKPTGEQLRLVALDYVLLDSYADALKWLDRAVALSPTNAEAWYDLGRARMHERRFIEAASALKRSLALRPASAKAEDNLGICLEAENQPEAALGAYERAIAIAKSEPHPAATPFVDDGALLNTRNGFEQALPLLQRATVLDPKDGRAFAELSRAYSGLGQTDTARQAMEQAVALDPKNSRLHFQLARLYRAAGMTDKAKHEFDLSSSLYGQKSAE